MHKTHYAQEQRKRIHECKYMKIIYITQLQSSSEKKNIEARTGFQPMTTAIPVQRSTVTQRSWVQIPNGPTFFQALFSLPFK